MESSRPSDRDASSTSVTDLAADLDLLERSRSMVDVDQMLDFGPWWYATLLATMIGGLTLFGQATDDLHRVASFLVAAIAAVVIAVHDHRRRSVRLRPTVRGVAILSIIALSSWILIGAWGSAVSSLGYQRFVPGYAFLAWVLTSLALLLIRAAFHAVRRRRPVLL